MGRYRRKPGDARRERTLNEGSNSREWRVRSGGEAKWRSSEQNNEAETSESALTHQNQKDGIHRLVIWVECKYRIQSNAQKFPRSKRLQHPEAGMQLTCWSFLSIHKVLLVRVTRQAGLKLQMIISSLRDQDASSLLISSTSSQHDFDSRS